MSETNESKIPIWFWIVTVVALLMNVMGAGMFAFESLASPESLAEVIGDENSQMVLNRTAWAKFGYGLSFYAGVIGCLLLLFRKRIAFWVLSASVLGMVIQQVYWWGWMDLLNTLKGFDWIWPIITPGIPIFMLWLARKATTKGWLK